VYCKTSIKRWVPNKRRSFEASVLIDARSPINARSRGPCSNKCRGRLLEVLLYLPCQGSSVQYESDICKSVGFIHSVLAANNFTDITIMGDTNLFKPLLRDHYFLRCDNLMGGVNTYANVELGHESSPFLE